MLMRACQAPGFCGSSDSESKFGSRVTKCLIHWSQNAEWYGTPGLAAAGGAGIGVDGATVFRPRKVTVACRPLPGRPKSVPQTLKPGYCVSPLPSG